MRGTPDAKSRLNAGTSLSLAIALDTVEAALAVAPVVVVTNPAVAPEFVRLGATVLDDPGGGLKAVVAAGIAVAGDGAVAVMLGDLPALAPAELREALLLAEGHPRALVADADGTGSVLIAALPGVGHAPAFGPDSRQLHVAAGYVELDVPATSGLRRDVDTVEQLEAVVERLGPRTRAVQRPARTSSGSSDSDLPVDA